VLLHRGILGEDRYIQWRVYTLGLYDSQVHHRAFRLRPATMTYSVSILGDRRSDRLSNSHTPPAKDKLSMGPKMESHPGINYSRFP
jgi:hypothetical protein